MDPNASTKMVVPSRLEEVHPVLERIMQDVEAQSFDQRTRFGIRLSLDEVVTNAIRHGNGLDESKHAIVEWEARPGYFEISVEDEGEGFDPEALPDPTAPENLTRPCGRGVMLMRAYMTKVHYNPRGNRVTLVYDQTQAEAKAQQE